MKKKEAILFTCLFILGILPRVLWFGSLPGGLFQDELANGVDAYDVATYRVDRTGMSYPIQFISWGSGQSALYAYTSIPFIQAFGLNGATIRLPNLIAGILTLPLLFLAGRKLIDQRFGLILMFLGAISPWSILSSRWGLEAYFVPFLFLIAFVFFLYSSSKSYWFIAGCVFLSLCLYTYSTAFAVVPVFLLLAAVLLLKTGRLNRISLWIGLASFTLLSLPMLLFIIINLFDLKTIYLYKISIPQLPGLARYRSTVSIFQSNFLQSVAENLIQLAKLMIFQDDQVPWNTVGIFGFLYPLAIVPITIGGIWLVKEIRKNFSPGLVLILFWLASACLIGVLQYPNIHRLSLLFIPLECLIGYFLYHLSNISAKWFAGAAAVYLILFAGFVITYFSPAYQASLPRDAKDGLIQAIELSADYPDHQVCLSEKFETANIYVLYVEKADPHKYLEKKGYLDTLHPFTRSSPLDRYHFVLNECDYSTPSVVILRTEDPDPAAAAGHDPIRIGVVKVYILD